jgi:hypothetical protein
MLSFRHYSLYVKAGHSDLSDYSDSLPILGITETADIDGYPVVSGYMAVQNYVPGNIVANAESVSHQSFRVPLVQ